MEKEVRRGRRIQFVRVNSSPALKIVVTVLIVFSMAALIALSWVRGGISSQIQALRQDAAALEQENLELQEKINNLGSVESDRQIAQEELGLVDPNTVIIQPEG